MISRNIALEAVPGLELLDHLLEELVSTISYLLEHIEVLPDPF